MVMHRIKSKMLDRVLKNWKTSNYPCNNEIIYVINNLTSKIKYELS